MFETTANDIYKKESKSKPILTLCRQLDNVLNGGIHLAAITEMYGAPGSGKTQLGFQLCVNVQIPKIVGGLDGAAIYIDTNNGFNPHRIKEIAFACCEHCKNCFKTIDSKLTNATDLDFSVEKILENIHFIYTNDYIELIGIIQNLNEILSNKSNIRLIIIDSFSYLFRNTIEDSFERCRIIYQLLNDLQQIGNKYNCAIVITNELTTRFITTEESYFVPALGDSHLHKVTYQILLTRDSNQLGKFYATIQKTAFSSKITVPFLFTKNGIGAENRIRKHEIK